MSEIIAIRRMFVKDDDGFASTEISISMPMKSEDGFYICSVRFTNPPKYNASNIKGIDGINSLECALEYIEGICTNSEDPEFHWEARGGRHKGRPA